MCFEILVRIAVALKTLPQNTTSSYLARPGPPCRSKLSIACSDLFYQSERTYASAHPFQTANVNSEVFIKLAAMAERADLNYSSVLQEALKQRLDIR